MSTLSQPASFSAVLYIFPFVGMYPFYRAKLFCNIDVGWAREQLIRKGDAGGDIEFPLFYKEERGYDRRITMDERKEDITKTNSWRRKAR